MILRQSTTRHLQPFLLSLWVVTLAAGQLTPMQAQILQANPDNLTTPASSPDSKNVLTNDTGATINMLGLAKLTATYEGGTSGTPPDPTTPAGGSWAVTDTEDGDITTGNITANASTDHNNSGLDAWVVRDATNSSGHFIQHTRTLSPAELSDANTYGWTLEATMRFIDDYDDGTSCMLQYGNGTRRFLIFFDLDANDDLTANLFGTGGGVITLTSGGTGTDSFHDYSLLYDPVTQTSSFLVDGNRVDGGSWTGQASGFSGVQWGTGSSGGQGTAAYHRVAHQVISPSITLESGAIANHLLGDVTFNPNGSYGPLTAIQTAEEPVRYVISDGNGTHDTGILTVTVTGENDDPVATIDPIEADSGSDVVLSIDDDLLGNASDVDGDTPTLDTFDTTSTEGGTITDNGNGTLTYSPPPTFSGTDSFTYTIIDGNGGSAVITVQINLSVVPKILKIFVLTGQSNSLGTLATSDVSMLRSAPGSHPAEQGMAVPFFWDNRTDGTPGGDAALGDSGGLWLDLAPQLGGVYPDNDDHWGPEIGFARMLWNAGYRDFGIVKASRGGGGNDFWVKGSADDHMYTHVVDTVNAAVSAIPSGFTGHEISGLLYLQGESNDGTEATEADIRFDALISNLETDLSITGTLAGVFGEIGGGSTTNRDLTRTRQQALAGSRSDIGYASSSGTNEHDGLHYDADSQLLIGERMASEMIGTGALGSDPLPAWPDLHAWFISDNGTQPNNSNTINRWASLNDGSAARDLTRTVNGRPTTLPVTSGNGEARQIMSFDGGSDLWASSGEFGTLADTRSVAVLCRLTANNNGFLFDGATSSGRTRAQIRDGDWQSGVSTSSWDVAEETTTTLTVSQWQQHVFTYDDNGASTDLTHWVDGVEVATPTDAEVSDLKGFIIASNGGSTFRPLHVEIAEVAVYDRVLDSTDIAALNGSWNSRWGTPTGPPFGVGVQQSPRSIPRFGIHDLLLVTIDNPTAGASTLDDLTVSLAAGTRDLVTSVSLIDGGTSPTFDSSAPVLDSVASPTTDTLNFTANLVLPEGRSYLWIAVEPARWAPLGSMIDGQIDSLTFSGAEAGTVIPTDGDPAGELTFDSVPLSVDIRTRGAHGLGATYRIPGIASDSRGWLHAVYDNRYGFGGDLPGDVDVGYNRSKDGGVTWEAQRIILDADASVDGSSGNGVGDPCILWDPATDTLWCASLWSFGNNAYHGSGAGTSPNDTGQYVLTKSTDGGDTWSPPINITTNHAIDPDWHLLWDPAWSEPIPPASGVIKEESAWNLIYQGPGHGLAMRDGTLVFPSQYRDGAFDDGNDTSNQVRSCSIFSADNGATWEFGSAVPSTNPQTNEMTLCELDDGRLLFSCRTPSGSNGQRAWAHYTPGGASPLRDGTWGTTELGVVNDIYRLPEVPDPVVQGSVIQWKSTFDGHPREWVLFANPATGGRNGMTLRISADGGITWPVSRLVYSGASAYSSLCILPDNSIGLLYEKDGYQHITFVRIEEDWLLNPDVDTDSDELPDAWELLYGTDPNVPDGDEDPDGDGATNVEERIAGTDPFNGESVLKLTSFSNSTSILDVTWASIPGKTYVIETSNDLTTWASAGSPITASGPSTFAQISHDDPARLFVRIRAFQ